MKTLALLRGIAQVELGAWDVVFDVPFPIAFSAILPCHSRQESSFKEAAKKVDVATQQLKRLGGFARSLDCPVYSLSKAFEDLLVGISLAFALSPLTFVNPALRPDALSIGFLCRPELLRVIAPPLLCARVLAVSMF